MLIQNFTIEQLETHYRMNMVELDKDEILSLIKQVRELSQEVDTLPTQKEYNDLQRESEELESDRDNCLETLKEVRILIDKQADAIDSQVIYDLVCKY